MAASPPPNRRGVALRLSHVRKTFGETAAVDDVSIEVEGGSFLTILGASGSGKSTTLTLLAGFLDPDSGEIVVDGRNIVGTPPHRRGFGVVFQNYALFPHMRVLDNIQFPLKMAGRPRPERRARADEMLRLVKLEGYENRFPHELSGGQQQRVALARALVGNPRLLLMDEPLSALDRQLREHMQLELVDIQRRLGVTVVYVTHDQGEALVMSDKIAIMHDGRVEQFGTPRDIYDRPATRYVAGFVGESNFLDGTIGAVHGDLCRVECGPMSSDAVRRSGLGPGAAVRVAIRPERLKLDGAQVFANRQEAVVEDAVYVGDALKIWLRTPSGHPLLVKAERESGAEALRPGDPTSVSWRAEDTILVETVA